MPETNRESLPSVAVIGLGALGLVTLKNLLDEGFDATGFDANPYVGGLWKYDEGSQTSVLESTITNISRERGCFTDFPFPAGTDVFPKADQVERYLTAYASHFALKEGMKLNTKVLSISRDEKRNQWVVQFSQNASEPKSVRYDKLVLANGINRIPSLPSIDNQDKFQGKIIHSINYKKPSQFTGKRVLIVGLANTAADTATSLVGHAEKIYLSHRHGAYVLPRWKDNKPYDQSFTNRMQARFGFMETYFPVRVATEFFQTLAKLQAEAFNVRPEWKLSPEPLGAAGGLIISDKLVDELNEGNIASVSGLKGIIDGKTVQLDDGTKLEVDTIILCTGYKPDFSILGEYDPSLTINPNWVASSGSRGKPLPRLYQNIFSLDHPDSLAIMGTVAFMTPFFQTYDLASMALAQVWKGNSRLPSKEQMNKAVDEHLAWVCAIANFVTIDPGIVKVVDWNHWVHDAAGTGINENLGYGLKGWWFWLRNPRMSLMLMTGLASPHIFRLFETGKRKTWAGAWKEIMRVNREMI
ncbi:hypothetical protein PVAG01_00616 [Phlyctema vagabunda]|uniref:Flavin-containing monooxygenase n=1 Tax=Phlyctema vagabunda TaxID=108571 RepID=A0ABR4PUR3_9HELO